MSVDRDLVTIQHAYVTSLQESRHKHKSACKHGTLGAFLSPTGGTAIKVKPAKSEIRLNAQIGRAVGCDVL